MVISTIFAEYANGSGIPQVMVAVEMTSPDKKNVLPKLLNLKIAIVKILSSLLVVLGGGLVGREGPTIQVASSVFMSVSKLFPKWFPKFSKKNIIVSGAASGLAAAFNTPLGGIVFAIEELSKTHFKFTKTALFSTILIAGLTAQAIAGPYLYLGYPVIKNLPQYVIVGVFVTALVSGLLGAIMSKLILSLLNFSKKLNFRNKILYIVACSLLVATIIFFSGTDSMCGGKELMNKLLFSSEKHTEWYMPFSRMAGMIFSFSTGASGGVFAPSLSVGASIGGVISSFFNYNDSGVNLLVLCGMISFLTGVTRSPFTSAILVLEMTDRHSVILYFMLSAIIANLIANLIDERSFYEHLSENLKKNIE